MRVELPRYPAYQPTGSAWIGEIPEGWDVLPFKRLCKRVDVGIAEAATHAYAETGIPIIRGTNIRPDRIEGEILWIEPWFAEKNRSKYMWAGDLVTVRTGYPGVTAVIPPEFDKSQCFTMIISTPKKGQDSRFYCYYFNSVGGMAHFEVEGWGSAQTNISVPTVQEMLVPFPPPEQQRAIVAFLDRETAKIDRLMAVRQKQVECLQEQRTAVIHHAVTKGLDPQAKTNPSGVGWLGNVPEQWSVKRLKFVADCNRSALPESTPADYIIDYIDIGNVSSTGDVLEVQAFEFKDAPSRARRRLTKGSVIISTVRTYLKAIAFIAEPADNLIVSTGFAVLEAKSEIRPKFLYHALASEYFIQRVIADSKGVGYPAINASDLINIAVAFPESLLEQDRILEHIENETSKFDMLIAKYQRELELLAEYRASLISHAVTGKIDVRSLVEPVPSEAT